MRPSLFERTPVLSGSDADDARREIREYFISTFNRYEQLFETLVGDQSYFSKPISLRHPLIFYFGHTATFFINKLVLAGLVRERIDPEFEAMFAVGVDEMSWDDLDEAHYDWPRVDEVREYRKRVREVMDELIQTMPLALPVSWNHPWWAILMCRSSRRIHLETSSVLIRQHALEYVKPHPAWQPCRKSGDAPQNRLVQIPAGKVRLGKERSADKYGWDNEYGSHEAGIADFQASRYLVSNGEFLGFVEDGGYANDACWEQEGFGLARLHACGASRILGQARRRRLLRLMTEEVAIPWGLAGRGELSRSQGILQLEKIAHGRQSAPQRGWVIACTTLPDVRKLSTMAAQQPTSIWIIMRLQCPVTEFAHGESAMWSVMSGSGPNLSVQHFEVHPLYECHDAETLTGATNRPVRGFPRRNGKARHGALCIPRHFLPSMPDSASGRRIASAVTLRKRTSCCRICRVSLRRRIFRRREFSAGACRNCDPCELSSSRNCFR